MFDEIADSSQSPPSRRWTLYTASATSNAAIMPRFRLTAYFSTASNSESPRHMPTPPMMSSRVVVIACAAIWFSTPMAFKRKAASSWR